ncbi:MAG TPA: hypothetical protein VI111_05550 [Thermoleophilaceae bacterium]
MSRPLTVWAVLLALLALPAGALAQSAGDNQYTDPLGAPEQPSDQGGQPQSGSGSAPPSTQSAPTQSTPTPAQTSPATAAANGDALPRTGLSMIPLLVAAAALLLGGFALRRVSHGV